ncbi:MAG: hypothetical protein GF350_07180, partial [Chitinivibrionales bacterium]|nr:hypothetical protein [Chitinivibrionales bacterium]
MQQRGPASAVSLISARTWNKPASLTGPTWKKCSIQVTCTGAGRGPGSRNLAPGRLRAVGYSREAVQYSPPVPIQIPPMNNTTIIPQSTYRLQLTPSFTFTHVREVLPYLKSLGISHIYASPVTRPCHGSLHGYDVCDPREVNPELGTRDELVSLLEEIRGSGMGWIQDIVPNHMAYSAENPLLMDVLEHGRASRYFDFFDIQWEHMHPSMHRRILAPFLGKPLGECLAGSEISLRYENKRLVLAYYEKRFPVRPESYFEIFSRSMHRLRSHTGIGESDYIRFAGVLYTLHNLDDTRDLQERYGQSAMSLQVFHDLYKRCEPVRSYIDRTLAEYTGVHDAGNQDLRQLLDHQHYRLCYWRVASEEINYRRFFTLNGLIAVHAEKEHVFDTTHALYFDLAGQKLIDGLRIDHIDGLFDPFAYLKRIRSRFPELYIVVEKILDHEECLPASWPVQGDTGYQFLNRLNGIFCNQAHVRDMSAIYNRFIGRKIIPAELQVNRKRLILHKHMVGD